MNVKIEESWRQRLQTEFEKPYFEKLTRFVKEEYAKHTIFPPGKYIFHAFNTCPFDKVKVVIIGQDPYHEPGQYYGLCFSVLDGVPYPPSLINIFKEIENDWVNRCLPRKIGKMDRTRSITDQCPYSRSGPIRQVHIREEDGKNLPMP